MSISLDPDQEQCSIDPDLGSTCLQRLIIRQHIKKKISKHIIHHCFQENPLLVMDSQEISNITCFLLKPAKFEKSVCCSKFQVGL